MPMTREQHLHLKLIEECAEVAKRAAKLMQFGPEESQETAPKDLRGIAPSGTNAERLQAEIHDLCAVVYLLGYTYPSMEQILAKSEKMDRYLGYSIKLGCVDPDR